MGAGSAIFSTDKKKTRPGDRSGSEVQSQADGSNLVGFFAS